MNGRPLVSIMLPCYEAAGSLPLAAASFTAQSLEDWECIALDDGSHDQTWSVLEDLAKRDARFRVERFVENRGRGAARQRILELARGKFLAFSDSDDWMFPDRLSHEVGWLEADDKIAAVGCCAAITDGPDRLIGIQRPRSARPLPVVASFDRPVPPAILFPTSMIRTDLAKQTGFDPSYLRSQDSDFLIRALLGRHYALGSKVLQTYSQTFSAMLDRTLMGYRYRIRSHLRHWREYPFDVAKTVTKTALKIATYRVAGAMGMERRLFNQRWDPVDVDTSREFADALAIVRRSAEHLLAS